MTEAVGSSSNNYYLPGKNEMVKEQKGLADPDAFLKILVAQMKYQNPMEPQDSATFVAQLSQMATMEQMFKVSQSMDKMAAQYEMDRYFQLIGHQVSLVNGDEVVTGRVGGVAFNDNKPYFYLEGAFHGEQYTMDQLIHITGNPNTSVLLPYLSLVGQSVTVKEGISSLTGTVEKVFLQDGNVLVTINGNDYSVSMITELHGVPEPSVEHPPESEPDNTTEDMETETTGEIVNV